MSADLKQRVIDDVGNWLSTACKLYGRIFVVDDVRFDIRRNAGLAGQYQYQLGMPEHVLRFNPHFLETETEDYLARTVPHEVAHLVNKTLELQVPGHVEDGHGQNWRGIMQDFGVSPVPRHRYDLSRARPHAYVCGCDGRVHRLSAVKHGRIQRGYPYICRKCTRHIEYLGKFVKRSRNG